jgi:sugar lactone lactonase YvrE
VLLTLGTPGQAGDAPGLLDEPNDVAVAPNGDIFVAEGHNGQNPTSPAGTTARIAKFDRSGRLIRRWGQLGSGPGEFRTPHALAFDARGRLFVADRGNHRIQIFDQEGKFLEEFTQFGRVSGIYLRNDTLYAIDSESNATNHRGWRKGLRIGGARDGRVTFFVPPHMTDTPEGAAGEGVAVDAAGNVYAAEVTVRGLTKYIKRLRTS